MVICYSLIMKIVVICYSLIMKKCVVSVCCTDNDEGATYTLCGHIVVSPNRANTIKDPQIL